MRPRQQQEHEDKAPRHTFGGPTVHLPTSRGSPSGTSESRVYCPTISNSVLLHATDIHNWSACSCWLYLS